MDNDNSMQTLSKYDRLRGGLAEVALFTKPSTIRNIQTLTGKAETFVVETCRHENGDYIFIEQVDEGGVVRVCLPPKVANAILAQHDSLTTTRRRIASTNAIANRIAAGFDPAKALREYHKKRKKK